MCDLTCPLFVLVFGLVCSHRRRQRWSNQGAPRGSSLALWEGIRQGFGRRAVPQARHQWRGRQAQEGACRGGDGCCDAQANAGKRAPARKGAVRPREAQDVDHI